MMESMVEHRLPDIVCVGNANIDAFLTVRDAKAHCHINEKESEICFPYGQKILVDSSEFLLGGGASNVAVGLSRLGFHSALVAEVGDDEFAQKIKRTLEREGVDASHMVQTRGAASSFSIGISVEGERTLFVRHVIREHNFQFDTLRSEWVYLGGLGREWTGAYERVVEWVKKSNAKLMFTPGTTQIHAGHDAIKRAIEASEVFIVNKEEAISIVNMKNKISNRKGMENLLRELQQLGSKIVVITDGENGSFAIDEKGQTHSYPASNQRAVERTGAGDAYATGFLAALMNKKTIEEAMRWGTKNAGSVIMKAGAQQGLLTRDEIEKS